MSAQTLRKAGCIWGCVVTARVRTIFVADAHRKRTQVVVCADEELTAFVELERAIHEFAVDLIS